MESKIYRNGKFEQEDTKSVLYQNSGIFLIPTLMALGITKGAHRFIEYEVGLVDYSIFAIFLFVGLIGYIYRTLTRIRPLAYKEAEIGHPSLDRWQSFKEGNG